MSENTSNSGKHKNFIYIGSNQKDLIDFRQKLDRSIEQLENIEKDLIEEINEFRNKDVQIESRDTIQEEILKNIAKQVPVELVELLLEKILFHFPQYSVAWVDIFRRRKRKKNSLSPANNKLEELKEGEELAKSLKEKEIRRKDEFELIEFPSVPSDLNFYPGHPIAGKSYRVHPLSNKLESKKNMYIPVELFDSILYKERESELIKILVDLGATKISIQELSSSKIQGSAEAEASVTGAGGVSGETKGENQQSSSADQVMTLKQKNWTPDNFKSDEYSWLPYEPDWESLVHARIEGDCLSSSFELTSDTSFSIDGEIELTEGLLEKLGSFGVGGEFSRLRKKKKRFEVKFVDV